MAIRVKLSNSPKRPVSFDQAFSSDRAAALAHLARAGPTTEIPRPESLFIRSPEPAVPREGPGGPATDDVLAAPGATAPNAPASVPGNPVPMATASAGETAADSGPQTAGAITPERAAGEQPPGSDGATNEAAEGAAGDASEALPNPSRAPGKLSASRAVVKWGSWAAVVVAIGFLALRFLVPFGPELRHPGKADAIANKDAPPAGAMVQPTPVDGTKSEANNNAPVSSPHDSVATAEAKKDVAVPRPAPPPVARPAAGVAVPDLAPYQEAVARLKVGGVMEGPAPRIYLDGRIVRCGEIINRNLGLRFMGVDAVNNAVLFTNADNVVFRKYY